MRVLIVGSGGREHAIAWKVRQSRQLDRLWIAPGNAGTARLGENIPITAEGGQGVAALTAFARELSVDLVLVGPEQPLADGLSDQLAEAGIAVFGPSRAAARLETSKSFAKDFMSRHNIPTARYRIFSEFAGALDYLKQVDHAVVIKASGLAGGKGVFLPDTAEEARRVLEAMLVGGEFGGAGHEVIIEERLEGEEVSVLAFCDGTHYQVMPPAQDHKRLLDGDLGPNTGGMGAYAPAPVCTPELLDEISRTVLAPTLAGLAGEEFPYKGVLYAGLILTQDGPKVLEFNCRFGDPETQVILPLLKSDLLEIALACTQGALGDLSIEWEHGAAACVVLASPGYPGKIEKGLPVEFKSPGTGAGMIFHGGTHYKDGKVLTSGGRVLGATGLGSDLLGAVQAAYQAVQQVSFAGMQYRRDIGWRGMKRLQDTAQSYAASGVDIDAGNQAVQLMSAAVRATYGPQVLSAIGAFGGLYAAGWMKEMQDPVLVASTDGVGTKVMLATHAREYTSIGWDIVNHCINDILVQGARPLFFLDYIACSKVVPQHVADVVAGIAAACKEAGCAVLGGETAEMPGVYQVGEFDLAGTIVGVVERERILPRPGIQTGDVLIGWESSGAHTNGYSLIRKVFKGVALETIFPELGVPWKDVLMMPHRSYLPLLMPILEKNTSPIKALAHITGGGFLENIPRILPEGCGALLQRGSWPVPPLFRLIQRTGNITEQEMVRVFNMGIGMVGVVARKDLDSLQEQITEPYFIIGEVVEGSGVRLV